MNITISFDIDGYTNNDELVAWLNAALTGEPIKLKRTRKPRKPMTDEEKAAFRARMVKGQEEAAKVRKEEELVKNSKPTDTKKAAPKPRTATKKTTTDSKTSTK